MALAEPRPSILATALSIGSATAASVAVWAGLAQWITGGAALAGETPREPHAAFAAMERFQEEWAPRFGREAGAAAVRAYADAGQALTLFHDASEGLVIVQDQQRSAHNDHQIKP
jgi:hypothetical protein